MKKGVIYFILGIFLTSFISAAYSYNPTFIDSSSIVFIFLFLIFFALISFALGRTPLGQNRAMLTILSFSISALSVYGLYISDFNLPEIFFNIGISEDLIMSIAPFIGLLLVAGIIIKLGLIWLFLILGLLFGGASAIGFFYEQGVGAVLSILCFAIAWWLHRRKNGKEGIIKRG